MDEESDADIMTSNWIEEERGSYTEETVSLTTAAAASERTSAVTIALRCRERRTANRPTAPFAAVVAIGV